MNDNIENWIFEDLVMADMVLKPTWNIQEAINLCRAIEPIAAGCGYHVGLTGGCLYKNGTRKDLDLIFYKHNSPENSKVDRKDELISQLFTMGINVYRKVHDGLRKAFYDKKSIDLFFMNRIGLTTGEDYVGQSIK